MKTRILYPKNIWFSREFHSLSVNAKTLALYLVSNENIGLIPIYKIRDLEICFTLSLKDDELELLKGALETTGLFYFYREYVFITNDFGYCDYQGRDRLMASKLKEEQSIPEEVRSYFKEVNNGLTTRYKPPINNKYKTINTKQETINQKPENKNTKIEVVEPKKERDTRIDEIIKHYQESIGSSLDGSVKENRQYAYLLLNKLKKDYPDKDPLQGAKVLIDVATKDKFHGKNATAVKYIYYNLLKIIKSYQENKSQVAVIF